MPANNFDITGLSPEEVLVSAGKYGYNKPEYKREYVFLNALKSLLTEPMVIILVVASVIYFISGSTGDGIFLVVSTVLISAISLYQDNRSRNALEQLKSFIQPVCKVIRNGITTEIKSGELVIGDFMVVEEGSFIAADGVIVHSNDFSVSEAVLTGESMPVSKDSSSEDNKVYQGTTVASGLAVAVVNAIGSGTRLGKIGKSLESIQEEKTPLELQIGNFVKQMVIAGAVVFVLVWGINYYRTMNLPDSLLKSLTLAMSILPEEIPVAFKTFMALGSWRLMKMGILVKQMKTVETLGSATVICTDKTGTITENRMSLAKLFSPAVKHISDAGDVLSQAEKELITFAMWASEPIAFDPMETALHEAYGKIAVSDERPLYKMVHEYPLGGRPPMMTHVFGNSSGKQIIAAKGAPEAIMNVCALSPVEKEEIEKVINTLSAGGYRILAVAEGSSNNNSFPATQQELQFSFKGLVSFYDPPRKNIGNVFRDFYNAGIAVKIVTGDNGPTTIAIARQVGFRGCDKSISGDELMRLDDEQLKKAVIDNQVFTRMFPEAKLRIINALKAQQQIVAMTGDGVNDGPALKAAHIGIAMGKKGTEIAKQAASLVLADDDLARMVDAIAMGRKIYSNLKKAVRYIISIHIPIILVVFIPLALGWIYPNIFSPVHVIFMELIMGPTCSVIYENEPMEKDIMSRKPRPFTTTFFSWKELLTSIVQGLVITAGALAVYRYAVYNGYNEPLTRSMVFIFLIASNIFLTLINRSFYYSIFTTIRYRNNLVIFIIAITIAITGLLVFVKPLAGFFAFQRPDALQFGISIGMGFICVSWYELVKWYKRHSTTAGQKTI